MAMHKDVHKSNHASLHRSASFTTNFTRPNKFNTGRIRLQVNLIVSGPGDTPAAQLIACYERYSVWNLSLVLGCPSILGLFIHSHGGEEIVHNWKIKSGLTFGFLELLQRELMA